MCRKILVVLRRRQQHEYIRTIPFSPSLDVPQMVAAGSSQYSQPMFLKLIIRSVTAH